MPSKVREPEKPTITFGPLEQAMAVLFIMTFVNSPAAQAFPLLYHMHAFFTPPVMMWMMIMYVGYYFLRRQEYARAKVAAASKPSSSSSSSKSSSSSSSSSAKALSSKDIQKYGLPSTKAGMVGSPTPTKVSSSSSSSKPSSSSDSKNDPSSNLYKKNYFLTMNGPARPALVPFPEGLRPKKGAPAGTMWWNNIPEDAKDLMAPPVDPDKMKAMVKNPWNEEMLKKDIELLKLTKRHKEEAERFEKVGHLLHTLFSLLMCFVDMRIGLASFMFFLWRHFNAARLAENTAKKDEVEEMKVTLMKEISDAKKVAPDGTSSRISQLQMELARL